MVKTSKAKPDANVYMVEKILKKRIVKGDTQYLIKWQNYSNKYNSWEPQENLMCPELIKSYEEEWSQAKSETPEEISDSKAPRPSKLEPEKIIGVSKSGGTLMYLLKWKYVAEADLITSNQAKARIPQLVIQFYENNISWKS